MTEFAVLRSLEEWSAKFAALQAESRHIWTRSGRQAVLSVGNFDGMHLGHQKILGKVVERARDAGDLAAVVTFDPHPLKVLRPGQAPPLLETLAQRLANFQAAGLDAALVLPFNEALSRIPAEEFAREILSNRLHASAILVGQNFRFGHRQQGDVALLQEIGAQLGFEVEIVAPVIVGGQIVSSSAVRRFVAEGTVAEAARLLGRPFVLTGEIERGTGRGSTVVVPTLNLKPEQELLPKPGVYATETHVGENWYRSVTNVGFRPTFGGVQISIETHVFEFKEMLTAGRLELRFWKRLRDERKFAGAEELVRQIAADIERAREFFQELDATPAASQPG